MANNTTDSTPQRKRVGQDEGAKYHLLSFVISILLTLFAFFAVASEEIPTAFAVPFILFLAVIQVVFQLYYWMHLKDKGHQFPALFLASGSLIAIITVLTFLIWVW